MILKISISEAGLEIEGIQTVTQITELDKTTGAGVLRFKTVMLTIGTVDFKVTYYVNQDLNKVVIDSIRLRDGSSTVNLVDTSLHAEILYNVEIHELIDRYANTNYVTVGGVEYKVNYMFSPGYSGDPEGGLPAEPATIWIRWVTLKGQPFDYNRELGEAIEKQILESELKHRK